MQNFCQLNKLCLKRNALKDRAIQRITLPIRMFNKGPKNLKYLDLSGNMFTDAIVPWLSAFQELECLDLSGSYLSMKGQKDLESYCSLKLCKSESNIHPVITNGWASVF
ncbi:leucine-rich repeat-containing protein 42 [Caerostris darwini]|uniref:Leucine-rich repeat-containing protein 42 n=1 Tax=Caerostris darwini TaxID=1538125 RepID=A0AAV4QFB2_9ARAC|nr:leucine-rich repeat-containing protein 42 [Caerostris darwini]